MTPKELFLRAAEARVLLGRLHHRLLKAGDGDGESKTNWMERCFEAEAQVRHLSKQLDQAQVLLFRAGQAARKISGGCDE